MRQTRRCANNAAVLLFSQVEDKLAAFQMDLDSYMQHYRNLILYSEVGKEVQNKICLAKDYIMPSGKEGELPSPLLHERAVASGV